MNRAFADTLYWQALFQPGDEWHLPSLQAAERLGSAQIVTTEEVFSEFLTSMAKLGPHFRNIAVTFVEDAYTNPEIKVIPQSHETFLAGLALYKSRPDKGYSLADCVSMITMRREAITDVLTNDHHFEQEGFTVLIR